MANDKTMVTIDPAGFTDTQWTEAFYASELLPGDERQYSAAFRATAEDIRRAAGCCRSKAVRVRAGELGTEGGEEQWAVDLEEAAAVLEAQIPAEVPGIVELAASTGSGAGEIRTAKREVNDDVAQAYGVGR